MTLRDYLQASADAVESFILEDDLNFGSINLKLKDGQFITYSVLKDFYSEQLQNIDRVDEIEYLFFTPF